MDAFPASLLQLRIANCIMCGRYALYGPISRHRDSGEELLFTFLDRSVAFVPRYNAAPTEYLPVYRIHPKRGRELVPLRWGVTPAWAKDPSIGAKMINAPSESIQKKPAFQNAFRFRRCLVPAMVSMNGKRGRVASSRATSPFRTLELLPSREYGNAGRTKCPYEYGNQQTGLAGSA
jgi:hypothetical protein